jgi:membrane-associated phospholipid phosphatase
VRDLWIASGFVLTTVDDYRSFPSGHAGMAFAAAAAAVTSETSKWWPKSTCYIAPVMYGGAALPLLNARQRESADVIGHAPPSAR